jgi:hypothetical protein
MITPNMAQRDEFTGHRITQRAWHKMRVPLQQLGHHMNIGVCARRHPDITRPRALSLARLRRCRSIFVVCLDTAPLQRHWRATVDWCALARLTGYFLRDCNFGFGSGGLGSASGGTMGGSPAGRGTNFSCASSHMSFLPPVPVAFRSASMLE